MAISRQMTLAVVNESVIDRSRVVVHHIRPALKHLKTLVYGYSFILASSTLYFEVVQKWPSPQRFWIVCWSITFEQLEQGDGLDKIMRRSDSSC